MGSCRLRTHACGARRASRSRDCPRCLMAQRLFALLEEYLVVE
ncbi:hypothetical protein ACFPRL_20530 [Pseudoclavibacter helvolus]